MEKVRDSNINQDKFSNVYAHIRHSRRQPNNHIFLNINPQLSIKNNYVHIHALTLFDLITFYMNCLIKFINEVVTQFV